MVRTILLADRDPLFTEQIRGHFLGKGYRVLCARTQGEAERILASTRPDILVTEAILDHPDSGFCLAWKAKSIYPDMPVAMVSAVTWHTGLYFSLSTPEDKQWIKADAFLDKPIRMEELETVITHAVAPVKAG